MSEEEISRREMAIEKAEARLKELESSVQQTKAAAGGGKG